MWNERRKSLEQPHQKGQQRAAVSVPVPAPVCTACTYDNTQEPNWSKLFFACAICRQTLPIRGAAYGGNASADARSESSGEEPPPQDSRDRFKEGAHEGNRGSRPGRNVCTNVICISSEEDDDDDDIMLDMTV